MDALDSASLVVVVLAAMTLPPQNFSGLAIVGITLLAGLSVWILWADRTRGRALSVAQRLSLCGLAVGLLGAWHFTNRALTRKEAIQAGSSDKFDDINIPTPIAAEPKHSQRRRLAGKRVLMMEPPARLEWTLETNVRAVSLAYGFDPEAYEHGATNGADIILDIVNPIGLREVFRRRLEPRTNPADRGYQQTRVILPPFSAGSHLILRTTPGENGDAAWDWVYVARVRFQRGIEYAQRQFPSFNQIPDRVEGDNSAILTVAGQPPLLAIPSPSVLKFSLNGSERTLSFSYGFLSTAYTNGGQTDGAIFRVELSTPDSEGHLLFERSVQPLSKLEDREQLNSTIALPVHPAGSALVIKILPGGTNAWDHTYISRLKLE